ncbi:DUF1150 domain-containing protein [Lentibacter algarum]|uniref:DUF1150 family protein n=1 Tax=Lentibacter algarum TaxID=576131 RepID=UPI001C06C545|nr:DUF1150 family protein [Lentibacter algarum]MBU2980255.1 DUF1150 domain-containing protein [Lentibacter algarum]
MDIPYEFATEEARPIVYVRAVEVKDLPKDVQAQAMGATRLYAVHDEGGERLALVKERNLAFTLARQNDLSPVATH